MTHQLAVEVDTPIFPKGFGLLLWNVPTMDNAFRQSYRVQMFLLKNEIPSQKHFLSKGSFI